MCHVQVMDALGQLKNLGCGPDERLHGARTLAICFWMFCLDCFSSLLACKPDSAEADIFGMFWLLHRPAPPSATERTGCLLSGVEGVLRCTLSCQESQTMVG